MKVANHYRTEIKDLVKGTAVENHGALTSSLVDGLVNICVRAHERSPVDKIEEYEPIGDFYPATESEQEVLTTLGVLKRAQYIKLRHHGQTVTGALMAMLKEEDDDGHRITPQG